jgi:hypothetical protein
LRAYVAFGALAKFAKIDLPDDWAKLRGEYKPSGDRVVPSDIEISKIREKILDPQWRWVFGILAAYGLRPHELFYLDFSKMPILIVQAGTKTGHRLVYPMPGRWVEEWDLAETHPLEKPEEKANKYIGQRIAKKFHSLELGIVPYGLRDAYAIRAAVLGIDSAIASKWMGHSLEVHYRSYLRFIDQIAHDKIWEKLGKD